MSTQSPVLITQVRVLDPVSSTDTIADVFLDEGYIKAIDSNLTLSDDIPQLDGHGLILAPGLVDLYSHSGEPGYEQRETLSSLAKAATRGGFTRLTILPDTLPPLDNPPSLTSLHQKTQSLPLNIQFWGAITQGLQGEKLTELADLSPEIIGFADGYPLENLSLLRRLLEYLQPLAKPVALVPTNIQLQGNGVMRESPESICFGLPGNPSTSESIAIASLLELVASTHTPLHLMRISTARGVELIADAKAKGLPVTASTTWMHLLFNTQNISTFDPNLRLEPPLGTPDDLQALISGVKEGVIDAIAVDHTPYTYEEKTLAFGESPPGAIGLELILPILWQRFVATGEWTALDLWRSLSVNPLLCLQQAPISCQVGNKTELILFDPQQNWTVNYQNVNSLSHNTPWWGEEITGRVIQTWVNK